MAASYALPDASALRPDMPRKHTEASAITEARRLEKHSIAKIAFIIAEQESGGATLALKVKNAKRIAPM
jgi:hypothetical protein